MAVIPRLELLAMYRIPDENLAATNQREHLLNGVRRTGSGALDFGTKFEPATVPSLSVRLSSAALETSKSARCKILRTEHLDR